MEALANWASNPNADEASAPGLVDATVNLAAGIRALKSERIRLDPRFNFWRDRSAV
jgi:hypothetical protein